MKKKTEWITEKIKKKRDLKTEKQPSENEIDYGFHLTWHSGICFSNLL